MTNPLFTSGEKLAAKFSSGASSIDDIKKELAKTASEEGLTAHQIERIVEKANRNILVSLQKEASKNGSDPHFTFNTIKTAEIIGMLDGSKSAAKPSLPGQSNQKPSFNWGPVAKEEFRDRSKETNVSDYTKDGADIPSKDVGILATQYMKDMLSNKKTDIAKTEIEIERASSSFGKEAYQRLLSGTPVEVMLSLPSRDLVEKEIDRVESYRGKLTKLAYGVEFEIEKDHPLFIMGQKIQNLRSELFDKKASYEAEKKKYEALCDKVRKM